MSNIIDYLEWRGDIPFSVSPLNEIDAAIFCQISYWNMDGIVSDKLNETITIKELCNSNVLDELPSYCTEGDREMKELIKDCERFSNIKLSKYVNHIDIEKQVQFSAVTFTLDNNITYVVYRGTDNTLVGWKECMDLAYSMEVEGQKEAIEYLNEVANETDGDIFVAGHSKGGNLAVYATSFSSLEADSRIKAIYDFDGPGFNSEVIQKEDFKKIEDRVCTFVPQDSVVGMLLTHNEPYQVISSTASNGFSQHYLFSWEVKRNKYIYRDKLTFGGASTNDAIKDWIDGMTFEEKRNFVEVLYDLVDKYGTVDNLFTAKNLYNVMEEYKTIEPEKKSVVEGAIAVLKKSMLNEVMDTLEEVKKKTIDKLKIDIF